MQTQLGESIVRKFRKKYRKFQIIREENVKTLQNAKKLMEYFTKLMEYFSKVVEYSRKSVIFAA